MASEAILKELFEVSKASGLFAGITHDEIWKACIAYQDRPDSDIHIAMENIREKDGEALAKSQEGRQKLELSKEKMIALQKEEASDRQEDERNAEEVLAILFNK